MATLRRFLGDESGTETVEWAIVIGLIATGAIVMALAIGGKVMEAFTDLNNGMALVSPN